MRHDLYIGIGTGIVSFIVYFLTAAPAVFFGDSGELSAAAYNLGVAHPPGYPLYLLLGKLFTILVPLGDIGFRMNVLSGLFASICTSILYFSGRKLHLGRLPSTCAALAAAFSYSFWSQAVVAEVYALFALFLFLMVYLTIEWADTKSKRTLLLLSLTAGFSMTHHTTIVVYFPALAGFLLWHYPKLLRDFRLLLKCLIVFLLPLCLYIFIPLRALTDIPNDWNNPETFSSMLNHILAGQYQDKLLCYGFSGMVHQIKRFLALVPLQFTFPLIALIVLGVIRGVKTSKKETFLLLAIFAINILYASIYYINDIEPYFIPSFLSAALLMGHGFTSLGLIIQRISAKSIRWTFYMLMFGVALIPLAFNWTVCDRSRNLLAYRYGLNMLNSIEPNGILIATGDTELSVLAYLSIVEKHRNDVTIYSETQNIFRFPIFQNINDPRKINLASIGAYERTLLQQSDQAVYFTDIMDDSYPLVPYGVLYRFERNQAKAKQLIDPWQRYNLEGLHDASLYDDGMTRVMVAKYHLMRAIYLWRQKEDYLQSDQFAAKAVKVARDQTLILKSIGKFYLQTNRLKLAQAVFKRALKADPFDPDCHNALGIIAILENQLDQAIEHFDYSLESQPQNNLAWFNRAMANEKKGDLETNPPQRKNLYQNALSDTQQTLRIDPNDQQARGALERIINKLNGLPH